MRIFKNTRQDPANVVDELGQLQAEIADLKIKEKQLKKQLIASTPVSGTSFEGELFRATVSTSERKTLNAAKAREKLLSLGLHQFVTAHTKRSVSWAVRVVARTGNGVQKKAA